MWRFLEVKPLRRSLLLLVQDVFLGFLEIFVGDLHAALTQGHEAGLCADGLGDAERKEERVRSGEMTSNDQCIKANVFFL